MSDFPDGSTLNEAITGRWHRIAQGTRKGTFLIELSDSLLLNVHIQTKSLDILIKYGDVFHFMGDLSFSGLDENGKFLFHSLGIDHVHFNNHEVQVSNPDGSLSAVFIQLSKEKQKQALSNL